jgi:hypothetical protein
MGKFSRALFSALDKIRGKPRRRYFAIVVDTAPAKDAVGNDDFYIVQSGVNKKWVFLRCPSGCGDVLNLSLANNRRPKWTVKVDRFARPTLNPSVRREEGCYSHFWIRHGVIEWCADTGQPPRKVHGKDRRGNGESFGVQS